MATTTTTTATINETCHSALSTPPSDPPLREGKGYGDEGKGGCRCYLRRLWDRANGGRVVMAVEGGGGDGVFATTINDNSAMVLVATMSLVDGSGSYGRSCHCDGGG